MPKMKKLRSPYFVKAEVLKNGEVKLVDDDGEIYNVELRRDAEWPLLSSRVRNREMRAAYEKMMKERRASMEPPKPPHPFFPRLVS